MDKFEEIGRRIDEELTRLRNYVDKEVTPQTERRTADFLREVSGKLSDWSAKLEERIARQTDPPSRDPQP